MPGTITLNILDSTGPLTETTPGTYQISIADVAAATDVTFQGPGSYDLTSVAGAISSYNLAATNGATLHVNGLLSVLSTANIAIDGASTVVYNPGTIAIGSTTNLAFTGGGGGTLSLQSGLSLLSPLTVSGFGNGDDIDFGTQPSGAGISYSVSYTPGSNGGTLSLIETSPNIIGGGTHQTTVGSVQLSGTYTSGDFSIKTDGLGNISIESSAVIPCFLPGTRIRTPVGDVAVEKLQAGDLICTLNNGPQPLKAVRCRTVTLRSANGKTQPVRIAAGALAHNLPARDLRVSPDHSMYFDGVLVPAQCLVNGKTITQDGQHKKVDYYHVELEPHEIIFAEGAATESYLDIGYAAFGDVVTLFPATEPKNWEDACAPIVMAGPQLATIRIALLARADDVAAAASDRLSEVA